MQRGSLRLGKKNTSKWVVESETAQLGKRELVLGVLVSLKEGPPQS